MPAAPDCDHCHDPLPPHRDRWCGDLCKWKGLRREAKGLPADYNPQGGRRGRVPLGQTTKAEERALEILDELAQNMRAGGVADITLHVPPEVPLDGTWLDARGVRLTPLKRRGHYRLELKPAGRPGE